jgi:beta-carotene hydroxylase
MNGSTIEVDAGALAGAPSRLTGLTGLNGHAVAAERPPGASKKPILPRELHQKSLVGAALFVTFSTALWVLPALLAFWLATDASWPTWARVLAWVPCCVLAAQGLHLLGWVGHEGFHFNLHENKKASAVLGILFSSMIMSFMQVGAAISHKTHHALTNQAGDPDIEIFRRFRTFWSRVLLGRVTCNRIYLRNTARMLLGREFPEYWARPPFRWPTMRRLAVLNVMASLAFLSLYVAIAWRHPLGAAAALAAPHLVGVFYTGLRSYVEHAGTAVGDFRDSRTRTAPFFSWWYYFNNYHLEHHLYPSVPCYRLPRVHAWLREHGYLDGPEVPIEPTVVGAYGYTLGRHQYPQAPT